MSTLELPGLERLMETCRARNLSLDMLPPGQSPPAARTLVGGLSLDPVLAAVYARVGKIVFAADEAGMGLFQWDDKVNELETSNRSFRQYTQPHLGLPVLEFGGESALACSYATVPSLADDRGHQSVVRVDCHEQPYALPVASDVDRFFDTYASFLEARISHPEHHSPGDVTLVFPWHVPEILARDACLVALLRAGRFDPLLDSDDETREWVSRVLEGVL